MHGYSYSVIGIGRSPDTNVKKINLKHALDLDRRGLLHRQYNLPPSKDTIAVPNNGYVVLRFRADNPGEWPNIDPDDSIHPTSQWRIFMTFFVFSSCAFSRLLVVPLPFPVSYRHRNEFNFASWHTIRFATSSTKFPNLWWSHAANTNQLDINTIHL